MLIWLLGIGVRAEIILIVAIVFFIYFFVQTFISDALWTAVYK